MTTARIRKGIAQVVVAALAAAYLGSAALPAAADTAPPDPATPSTVSADALPTAQIDGVVWSQVVVGNTVYVAGKFGTARPAGAAPGSNTVPRSNLLAYDIRTGVLSSFAPTLNAQALAVTASPDGSTIYVGGDFTTVNGQARSRIAAFSTATGALVTAFHPTVSSQVRAIVATSSAVYLGGNFSSVSGLGRRFVAAVDPANGAVFAWNPSADATVNALTLTADRSKLVLGGRFQNLGTTPAYGLGAVDPVTGSALPWATTDVVRDAGTQAAITSLASDADGVYGSGYVFGSGGNLEGSFRADSATGRIIWLEDCHGDTYSVFPTAGAVYTSSHKHYCGNIGGFPQTTPWTFHHSTAYSKQATGTITPDPYGYYNFAGQPSPTLLNWFPTWSIGSYTGQYQAGWSVAGNSQYVVYGGEFPRVNGQAQQGLVRFAVSSLAPNKVGPNANDELTPSVVSLKSGTARVAWQATFDQDNVSLTYKVFRNFRSLNDTPVCQTTADSTFWQRPTLGCVDTTATPGQTYTYRVYAFDAFGNSVTRNATSVTIADTTSTSPYADDVLGDGATNFWRLGEASGSRAFDWAGYDDLTLGSGTVRAAAGAVAGDSDAATSFDGTADGSAATSSAAPGPGTFTVEAWVRTTSTAGGKIIGFGNSPTGTSTNYDRHVYLDSSGHVVFGVYPGGVRTISSPAPVNDGEYHHVVASLSSAGMALYVDGKRVARNTAVTSAQPYSGYWRVGGDNLNGWTARPSSDFLAGTIDDVAVYPTALTLAQVQQHYVHSGRTLSTGVRPTDPYGAAVYDSSPDFYWRLGETSGPVAADTSANGVDGVYSGGVTYTQPGATTATGPAVSLDGDSGAIASSARVDNPTVYSEELWFRTTTTRGGKLIGFGREQTGSSGSYDRHVYMFDDGRLRFGVWTGQTNVIDTPDSYNDGAWHYMVATQDGDGMKLWVDGQLVGTNPQTGAESYSGYWRVGGDHTWGGASSDYFAGTVDEVAVYSTALSASEVQAHFTKGGGELPNQPPTARFTSSASGLTASFDGTGSSDPDGTVASYAWDFGDGSSSTQASPHHAYGAPGTYTVTLAVTDDRGGSDTVRHDVTVAATPNQAPTARFTSSASGLTASFDGTGSSDPDGTVASYAWDFGDGASSGQASPEHVYAAGGDYTVRLTVTDNDGATDSTTKSVTVTAPNEKPTARFTSSASGLTASFDGTGSSDPDGTVASYAWDFGDGASSGQASPEHVYAASGDYTVTLTVTDNDGATDSTTKSVTVTAPASEVFARDDFARTVTGGLGKADVGGDWVIAGGAANISVDAGLARLRMVNPGAATAAYLAVSSTSSDAQATVSLDKAATGGGIYVGVVARGNHANAYRGKVRVLSTGALQLIVSKVVSYSETTVASTTIPGALAAGDTLTLRMQADGTSPTALRLKAWRTGATEPAQWQIATTDATAGLQQAGGVGIWSYLSGSATNAPVTASFDDLVVRRLP